MFWRESDPWGAWEPFRDYERLQAAMNQILSETRRTAPVTREYPLINIWSGEEHATICAEIPGVDPKDIDISIAADTVTIRGVRTETPRKETEKYLRRERGTGEFARTIQLPFQVAAEKVDASFRRGILYLSVPRAEADKPRKIIVKTATH